MISIDGLVSPACLAGMVVLGSEAEQRNLVLLDVRGVAMALLRVAGRPEAAGHQEHDGIKWKHRAPCAKCVPSMALSRKLWQAKVDWLGNPLLTMWNGDLFNLKDAFWGDGKANHPLTITKILLGLPSDKLT